jgi:NAD dependent epimerase/dehydratase family enzyme
MPVPAFAMRLAMGEMSAIVLDGAKVAPSRFLAAGFEFRFPEVVSAIKDLITRKV